MAREPDNLVLTLLREIRDTQKDHSRLLNQHSEEFSRLNTKMEEWQETTATAAGFAFHSNVRHEAVQRKLDELEERLKRLEEHR
jgi:ubiquinone biosynthesis protein UbiJ